MDPAQVPGAQGQPREIDEQVPSLLGTGGRWAQDWSWEAQGPLGERGWQEARTQWVEGVGSGEGRGEEPVPNLSEHSASGAPSYSGRWTPSGHTNRPSLYHQIPNPSGLREQRRGYRNWKAFHKKAFSKNSGGGTVVGGGKRRPEPAPSWACRGLRCRWRVPVPTWRSPHPQSLALPGLGSLGTWGAAITPWNVSGRLGWVGRRCGRLG